MLGIKVNRRVFYKQYKLDPIHYPGMCGIGLINYAEADLINTHILYLDVNNLYGAAMSQYLPYEIIEYKVVNEGESQSVLETMLSYKDDGRIEWN